MRHSRKKTITLPSNKKKKRIVIATKILAILYLVALMIFEFTIVILDVLPAKMMLIVMAVLGTISIVIFIQLFFSHIKKWAKILATVLSVLLITGYSFGTVYSIKTMEFLSGVSSGANRDATEVTDKSYNILITGMDTFGYIDTKGRSDVNMIMTVNPKKHKILLTSIPRDYQIRLMNYNEATDKLTHTGFYGVDDTISSIEDLMGININYYIKVNFSTVIRFIDYIGGVDVESDYNFTASTATPSGAKTYNFVEGENHLDGAGALAFARARHQFAGGDRQRVIDQQKVLEAMLDKVTGSTMILKNYTAILKSIKHYTKMNLTSAEIRSLIKMQLRDNSKWKIEKQSITGGDSYQITYTGGATEVYVMAQDQASIDAATAKIKLVKSNEKKKSESSSN